MSTNLHPHFVLYVANHPSQQLVCSKSSTCQSVIQVDIATLKKFPPWLEGVPTLYDYHASVRTKQPVIYRGTQDICRFFDLCKKRQNLSLLNEKKTHRQGQGVAPVLKFSSQVKEPSNILRGNFVSKIDQKNSLQKYRDGKLTDDDIEYQVYQRQKHVTTKQEKPPPKTQIRALMEDENFTPTM